MNKSWDEKNWTDEENLNGGVTFEDGNGISAEAINQIVENIFHLYWLLGE